MRRRRPHHHLRRVCECLYVSRNSVVAVAPSYSMCDAHTRIRAYLSLSLYVCVSRVQLAR